MLKVHLPDGRVVEHPDGATAVEVLRAVFSGLARQAVAAKVDGEIFNKSLAIDPNVQFEGVSRRLERPVENPKAGQPGAAKPEAAVLAARLSDAVA